MSIDWPYKKEDLKEIVYNLEQELNLKNKEIQIKTEQITSIYSNLETLKNKTTKLKAKLEFMNDEIFKFETDLEKSHLKLDFLNKKIESLRKKNKLKEDQLSQINIENNNLRDEIKALNSPNQKLGASRTENLVKRIREIFSYKGFLSEKEFEDMLKK